MLITVYRNKVIQNKNLYCFYTIDYIFTIIVKFTKIDNKLKVKMKIFL